MLDDTIEQLRAVALGAGDASGYFPAMYARVTDRIRAGATDGRFADPDGMVRFAHTFAGWYLRSHAGDGAVPRCWRATWDVVGDSNLLIVQHLLLGINAHINHDLPQVVVAMADETGDLAGMRRDFDAVNEVLAATLPDVLDDLGRVSQWVNLLAIRRGGRFFNFSIDAARDQAWRAAERIHALDAVGRAADIAELDRLVSVLAHLVARPGRPARWVVPIGRWFEENDPTTVTTSLLGDLA